MSLGGYPSLVSFTNMANSSFKKTSWNLIPDSSKLRYKTHELLSEFESVIVDLGLDNEPTPEQGILSTRIKEAEVQLDRLHSKFSSTNSACFVLKATAI